MHIKVAARPILCGVFVAMPRVTRRIHVVVAAQIGHFFGLEVEIHGETAHRLRQSSDASSISRAKGGAFLEHFEHSAGMHGGNDAIGGKKLAVGGVNSRGAHAVVGDFHHAAPRFHASAPVFDAAHEPFGHLLAAAHDAKGTSVVKVGDKGVRSEGCVPETPRIEGRIPHQHAAQKRIAHQSSHHFVDTPQPVVHHGLQRGVGSRCCAQR